MFATALFTPGRDRRKPGRHPEFEDYKRKMPSDAQAIFVAPRQLHFLGQEILLDSEGASFDACASSRDGKTFTFVQGDYQFLKPVRRGHQGNAGCRVVRAARQFQASTLEASGRLNCWSTARMVPPR